MGIKLVERKPDPADPTKMVPATYSDGGSAIICFESDLKPFGSAIMELQNSATKAAALAQASKMGVSRAGLDPGGAAYPVDANGVTIMENEAKIAGYRIDIKVNSGLL